MKRLTTAVVWSSIGLAGLTAAVLLWLLLAGDGHADGIEGGDDTEITAAGDGGGLWQEHKVPRREIFARRSRHRGPVRLAEWRWGGAAIAVVEGGPT